MNRLTRIAGAVVTLLGLIALLSVVGCATGAARPAQVTVLHDADPAAAGLVAYLESRHVPVTKTPDGATRIEASAPSREALIRLMGFARLKMDTCAANIANNNTTRDVDGKPVPYRRRYVMLTANGEAIICVDESELVQKFQPGHPDAAADGKVLYPNIDLSIEFVTALEASHEYETAAEVLRRLDPTIVLVSPQSANAFAESDLDDN